MKVLVTGSSGQLGSDVINELRKRNHQAIRVDIHGDVDYLLDITKEDVKEESIEKYIKKVLEFNSDSEIDRNIILKLINKIVLENKKIKSISYNFSI